MKRKTLAIVTWSQNTHDMLLAPLAPPVYTHDGSSSASETRESGLRQTRGIPLLTHPAAGIWFVEKQQEIVEFIL